MFSRGTIFERALKWMALVGVVFALGAGSAAAQITVAVPDEVGEGDTVTLAVGGTVSVPANDPGGTVAVSFTAAPTSPVPSGLTAATATDWGTPGPASITIAPNTTTAAVTRQVSGTITWVLGTDLDAESEAVTLTFTQTPTGTSAAGSSIVPATKDVTIKDSHTQMFEWGPVPTLKEAGTAMITLTANPTPTSAGALTYPTDLVVEGQTGYTIAPTSHTFDNSNPSVSITITAPNNDSNRTDDEIMLRALVDGTVTNRVGADPVSITVEDLHELPEVTAKLTNKDGDAITSAAEGDDVTLTFSVAAAATEAIKITLSEAASSTANMPGDYTLSAMEATIASGATTSGDVTVTLASNDDIGDEMLVLNGVVTGAAANGAAAGDPVMVTLTVMDQTVKQVSVKSGAMTALYAARDGGKGSDGMLNPGDDFSVGNDMLFESADGFTFQVDAQSSMPAVVSVDDSSGNSIMVMPESVGGPAKITLTATALPETSSFRGTQVSESVATIEFEVTVEAVPTGAPDTPAAPKVTAAQAQRALDVSWTAPDDNGSAILDYELRYKMSSAADWTVMTARVKGTSTTLTGLSAGTSYDVQVKARNADGSSDWSPSGTGKTAAAPVAPVVRGQITEFKLVGDGVDQKTIGGVERYHVPEGSQAVDLSVTVRWSHDEIAAIGYNTAQTIEVSIMSGGSTLPNWVSWIDGEGDVHFPRAGSLGNLAGGVVTVRTPRESQVPAAQRGSERHYKDATGTLDVLILHDDHEAENDAFYIEATGGDVDLNAPRAVNAVTPEVVIEDDEDQTVTVKMGSRTSSTVYEGDSGDDVPEFTVAASPARVDLPLEVRLDMVDLGGTTVSSGEISLSKGSMTLNPGGDGKGNSDTVTVHLPASDGNRVDDDYELHASVNVYSVASGGYETIPAASHPIKVLDRHKLPTLMVTPATGTVEEGGMVELTLTINRNPSNTPVSSSEKLQYTQEEVSIMLDMGAGSTAGASDFSVMTNPVVFPKRERGSYTASKTVEVMATADDVLDDMEMLVLDAMVAGAEAANGSEKDTHMGVSTLTIEEGTAKLVWANSQEDVEAAVYAAKDAGMGDDMTFTAGEMIEVMGALLFSSAEGVTVAYTAESSMSDVASVSVSGGSVMVTAMGAGMADITITAHGSMPSGVKIVDQTDPGMASIMFPVEVGLEALSIMLSGPEDPNIVEGRMGAMVTATANRAVTEEVTVNLMRDRSMSTAGDADYTADAITIASGAMSGSTMVMAVEDDMMETVDNMPEELVLYGMAEGMAGEVTGEVHLHLWDAAVPALPVIAQLLLAAFLAVGGYRRYRRR